MESLAPAAILGITITPGHIECTTCCTEAMRLGLSGDSPALTTVPSGFTVIPGSATAASIAALVPSTVSSGMMGTKAIPWLDRGFLIPAIAFDILALWSCRPSPKPLEIIIENHTRAAGRALLLTGHVCQ